MSAATSIDTNVSEELKASDFCFFVQEDGQDGDTIAYFCPLKFFRENGHMSDEYYDALDEFVPMDMDEMADNCYGTSRSVEEVREELLKLGFVEDEAFNEFMGGLESGPAAATTN